MTKLSEVHPFARAKLYGMTWSASSMEPRDRMAVTAQISWAVFADPVQSSINSYENRATVKPAGTTKTDPTSQIRWYNSDNA